MAKYIYILIEIDGNGICLAELTTFSLKDHHSLTGPDSNRTGFPPNEPHVSDGPHDPFPRRCFEPVQLPATFPRRSPTFFFHYCTCMLQKTTSFSEQNKKYYSERISTRYLSAERAGPRGDTAKYKRWVVVIIKLQN